MKLRACFPQLALARQELARMSSRAARRRAFWPTSRAGAPLPDEAAAAATPAPAAEPEREPEPIPVPVLTRDFAAAFDWPSTVAAWRSTTVKPDERS